MVRGLVLNMAGWKPSPVTTATGPDPDGLKLLKPPLFLQFLYKPRHTEGVFSRHLLRKPPKKEGNLPELLLSCLRLSNPAYKSDGKVHLLLCWNGLKEALHYQLHWSYALLEEVLFIFWELLWNDHSVNCQVSTLGLWREGQKIPNAASRNFICTASSAQICSACYSSLHGISLIGNWVRKVAAEDQLCQYTRDLLANSLAVLFWSPPCWLFTKHSG